MVFFLGRVKDSFFPSSGLSFLVLLSLGDFKTSIFLGHFELLERQSVSLYFLTLCLQHLNGVLWGPRGVLKIHSRIKLDGRAQS